MRGGRELDNEKGQFWATVQSLDTFPRVWKYDHVNVRRLPFRAAVDRVRVSACRCLFPSQRSLPPQPLTFLSRGDSLRPLRTQSHLLSSRSTCRAWNIPDSMNPARREHFTSAVRVHEFSISSLQLLCYVGLLLLHYDGFLSVKLLR